MALPQAVIMQMFVAAKLICGVQLAILLKAAVLHSVNIWSATTCELFLGVSSFVWIVLSLLYLSKLGVPCNPAYLNKQLQMRLLRPELPHQEHFPLPNLKEQDSPLPKGERSKARKDEQQDKNVCQDITADVQVKAIKSPKPSSEVEHCRDAFFSRFKGPGPTALNNWPDYPVVLWPSKYAPDQVYVAFKLAIF